MMRPQVIRISTPEQVDIDLEAAGFGRRACALLLDLLMSLAVVSLLAIPCRLLPTGADVLAGTTLGFAVFWGWPVWFELRHGGRTPGKRLLGLRVVDARGLPLDPRQALVRNVVRILDLMPAGGLGLACLLLHPQRRRLGDLVADTLVVAERLPLPRLALEQQALRASSLDTPRLRRLVRHRLPLAEREFLLVLCQRAPDLDPERRFDLFRQVATRYRQRFAIDDGGTLSDENLVRGVLALVHQG